MTATKQIIASKAVCVNYITATHKGQPTYYYVAVLGNKMPTFTKALQSGPVELTKWGKIIASGYDEPSKALKKDMAEKFHCDSTHAINLLNN